MLQFSAHKQQGRRPRAAAGTSAGASSASRAARRSSSPERGRQVARLMPAGAAADPCVDLAEPVSAALPVARLGAVAASLPTRQRRPAPPTPRLARRPRRPRRLGSGRRLPGRERRRPRAARRTLTRRRAVLGGTRRVRRPGASRLLRIELRAPCAARGRAQGRRCSPRRRRAAIPWRRHPHGVRERCRPGLTPRWTPCPPRDRDRAGPRRVSSRRRHRPSTRVSPTALERPTGLQVLAPA